MQTDKHCVCFQHTKDLQQSSSEREQKGGGGGVPGTEEVSIHWRRVLVWGGDTFPETVFVCTTEGLYFMVLNSTLKNG